MKASIGCASWPGTAGFTSGWSDQCGFASFAPANSSGQLGPASIHAFSVSTSAVVSRALSLFFGGISMSSSSPLTKWMSGLAFASCGTIARSPLSPPLIATSLTSSRYPFFCFSGP